jgi:hypothetical protein
MTRSVLSGLLLLSTLSPGRGLLLGQQTRQQQTKSSDLPEAPQPSLPVVDQESAPVQEPPVSNNAPSSRSVEGVIGRGQKSNSRPGFPPISPPAPGGLRVPPASRPNIFGMRAQCLPDSSSPAEKVMSCSPDIPMFARFLDSTAPLPLTPRQKFILATKNVSDPFNLLTIGAVSAISIASNANSQYGPGFPGFGKNVGVSFTQDATGEFFGTFLIPSLAHQDPHYHRMPNLSLRRRILHVLDEVVIAQSDAGTPMFNYATVVGTICTSSLGNVYVPGRKHNFGASTARIATSFATDPIGNAITEFVPDLARHVNFQVVVVQRLINRVAIAEGAPPQ